MVKRTFLTAAFLIVASAVAGDSPQHVSLIHDEAEQKVDISIGGKYFTSYLYGGPLLKKPVLYPVFTSSGRVVTRGFPIDSRPGERIDHTHHYGIWFNHGDVNGIDFWNSGRTPPKPGVRYGSIRHSDFLEMDSGEVGTLVVHKEWVTDTGEVLLLETTRYEFSGYENRRVVSHSTTLKPVDSDVLFEDSKEGMFAIRVARQMEVASDEPTILLGPNLEPLEGKIVANEGVSGHYRNSEGVEGYPAVWGKRARWMQLSGVIEGDPVSISIFDHPSNVNHPPHWMARDYGLYGVNSLGSAIYTKGEETLNYVLEKSDTISFRHQMVITDGHSLNQKVIDGWYQEFVEKP